MFIVLLDNEVFASFASTFFPLKYETPFPFAKPNIFSEVSQPSSLVNQDTAPERIHVVI